MKRSGLPSLIGRFQSTRLLEKGHAFIISLNPSPILSKLRSNSTSIPRTVTMSRPTFFPKLSKVLFGLNTALLAVCLLCVPATTLMAQDMGTTPQFNTTVQGETAATTEGTLINIVNFIGNVACPIGAALSAVHGVIQYRNNRPWMTSAVGTVALLSISGIERFAETMVMNGASGR